MGTEKRRVIRNAVGSGVADALFNKVQQRVLAVLFGNHGRSFYVNELIAMAGSGSGAVQRELARFVAAGLVTVKRVGNQKHYQANPKSPVFAELRGLILKTSGLVDVVRASLAPLASQIGAAFVFGSVAKSMDAAESDIDLLAITQHLTYRDIFAALESATSRLGRVVNPTIYSRNEFERRRREGNVFLKRVMAQPRLWVIGDEGDLGA